MYSFCCLGHLFSREAWSCKEYLRSRPWQIQNIIWMSLESAEGFVGEWEDSFRNMNKVRNGGTFFASELALLLLVSRRRRERTTVVGGKGGGVKRCETPLVQLQRHNLTLLYFPHVYHLVLTRTRQKPPIQTEPYRPNRPLVPLKLLTQMQRRHLLVRLPALPHSHPLTLLRRRGGGGCVSRRSLSLPNEPTRHALYVLQKRNPSSLAHP